jgi:hypothetical protein
MLRGIFVFVTILSLTNSVKFRDLTYPQLNAQITLLNGTFSHIMSSKSLFGTNDVVDGTSICSPLIARVSDLKSLSTDRNRPQVLVSGEIHGDERVVRGLVYLLLPNYSRWINYLYDPSNLGPPFINIYGWIVGTVCIMRNWQTQCTLCNPWEHVRNHFPFF